MDEGEGLDAGLLDRLVDEEAVAVGRDVLGSTRGRAGICLARQTFQDPEPACPEFQPRRS